MNLSSLVYLSYPIDGDLYEKGPLDLVFTAAYTVYIMILRDFIMRFVLRPLARRYGINKAGKVLRFQEQCFLVIYCAIATPAGLKIMHDTNQLWFFRTAGFYEGYPHRLHTAAFKSFYLLEAAFWLSQSAVILFGLEKRRRDFRVFAFHHVVTLALIGLSYRFHFTYFGLPMFITMDTSDFFLASSKVLNYLDSPLQFPFFTIFVGVWIYCRHYLNLIMMWSIFTEYATVGPYEFSFAREQFKCGIARVVTFLLLAALQAVNLYWLKLLLGVGLQILQRQPPKDTRSDDEDDNEVNEIDMKKEITRNHH